MVTRYQPPLERLETEQLGVQSLCLHDGAYIRTLDTLAGNTPSASSHMDDGKVMLSTGRRQWKLGVWCPRILCPKLVFPWLVSLCILWM